VAVPAVWPLGALAGLSPFHSYPVLAAVALTVTELALARLLTVHRDIATAAERDRHHPARSRSRARAR
jgi:hypothetical protein